MEHLIVHKFDCLPILDLAMKKPISAFPQQIVEDPNKFLL